MSNHSSDNTPVIPGIIGGVLLLGFVGIVVVFFGVGLFFWPVASPPRARAPMPATVETTSVEPDDSVPQDPALPTKLPVAAPVPGTPPTFEQSNDDPVIAPVPDTVALP